MVSLCLLMPYDLLMDLLALFLDFCFVGLGFVEVGFSFRMIVLGSLLFGRGFGRWIVVSFPDSWILPCLSSISLG
jgi:hypothetical protein